MGRSAAGAGSAGISVPLFLSPRRGVKARPKSAERPRRLTLVFAGAVAPPAAMWGRLPLPQVALAVALGVASGLYIYRPVFQPPPQPPDGAVGPPADAVPAKRP